MINRVRFCEIDSLREVARDWNVDFTQLERGSLDAELIQVGAPSSLVSRIRLNRVVEQRGATVAGTRNFGLVEARGGAIWCGWEASDSTLQVIGGNADFEAVSRPGFQAYVMSFTDQRLASVAETLGLGDPAEFFPESPTILRCSRSATDRLRRRLHRMFDVLADDDRSSETYLSRHEPEILTSVLLAMERPRSNSRQPSTRLRRVALARARAYIEEHVRENVLVLDLCREARVSLRTLEYAFLDHYGSGPKAYLVTRRLHGVRRALCKFDPRVGITDVANSWGFWHMGQFAIDYRRQFGELPSETLRRSRPIADHHQT